MKLYKLTDSKGNTRGNTHWGVGTSHKVTGVPRLCSNTVLHAYTSPLLAVLLNPIHANIKNPRCFKVEGDIAVENSAEVGCQKLTVIGTYTLPKVSTTQRVAFGILSALEVYQGESFIAWANKWLSGKDRSKAAANAAYTASAANAAYAANAANAAYTAAYAAAYTAANAADAANAAYAAAYTAAYTAAYYAAEIDLQAIAEKAMEY